MKSTAAEETQGMGEAEGKRGACLRSGLGTLALNKQLEARSNYCLLNTAPCWPLAKMFLTFLLLLGKLQGNWKRKLRLGTKLEANVMGPAIQSSVLVREGGGRKMREGWCLTRDEQRLEICIFHV